MFEVASGVLEAAFAHARAEHPREACGLIVGKGGAQRYFPCRNAAPADTARDRFVVDPRDWASAEDSGTIQAVVHSHPDASCQPSGTDRVMCARSGLPWIVVAVPAGTWAWVDSSPMPLVGRAFEHGAVDCYTLVQDYYRAALGLELPEVERSDDWWDLPAGDPRGDLYLRHFSAAGFVEVPAASMRVHDGILMQIRAEVPNHAAVFVGQVHGRDSILQHLHGHLSGHDPWGGYWERHTVMVLRHRSLIEGA